MRHGPGAQVWTGVDSLLYPANEVCDVVCPGATG